ncbi:MAG TPA: metal-dependent hydrolase, partial [Aeromicrobium sp.]|nr:metal-dependent hydrolase [Aeromicrobium sp.]
VEHARIEPGHMAASPFVLESMPWSHSLLALAGWAAVSAALYFLWRKDRRGAWVVAGLVLSHWVLDWVTHEPDMPLYPSGDRYGLGLWNSLPATVAVELVMFVAGVWIYTRATSSTGAWGGRGLAGLVAFLLLAYGAAEFGTPPTSIDAMPVVMLAMVALITLWAWAVDRQRVNVDGKLPKTTDA